MKLYIPSNSNWHLHVCLLKSNGIKILPCFFCFFSARPMILCIFFFIFFSPPDRWYYADDFFFQPARPYQNILAKKICETRNQRMVALLCTCSLFSLNKGLSALNLAKKYILYIFVSCNQGPQWDFIVKFNYVLSEITTKYCMCNLMWCLILYVHL